MSCIHVSQALLSGKTPTPVKASKRLKYDENIVHYILCISMVTGQTYL